MRGASETSSFVTLLRALAHEGLTDVRDFSDPTASAMLPPLWRLTLRSARTPLLRERLFGGRTDLIPLRTRALDDAWREAHAAGARQLVLLGAGLDGRAFRLDDIGDAAVIEVDHPSTQRVKRERTRGLVARAQRHAYVPVDFERDDLAGALGTAGLSRDAPTFWIWEGVTPYLTRRAQEATLAAIARSSARRSRLAMTYIEPGGQSERVGFLAGLIGEPFIGLMSRDAAAALLAGAGFTVREDTGVPDWARRYSRHPDRATNALRERIAVAELA